MATVSNGSDPEAKCFFGKGCEQVVSVRSQLLFPLLLGGVIAVSLSGCGDSSGARPNEERTLATDAERARFGPAIAAIGEQAFVYGGFDGEMSSNPPFGDAYLLSPSDGTIDPVPTAPVEPLANPTAVAVEGSVMVLGVECAPDSPVSDDGPGPPSVDCGPGTMRGARFDPSSGSWDAVDVPDELARVTDLELLGALGSDAIAGSESEGTLWTVDGNDLSWTRVDLPVALDDRSATVDSGNTRFSGCSAGPDQFVFVVWPGQGGSRTTAVPSVLREPGGAWHSGEPFETMPGVTELACSPDGALLYIGAPGMASWWFDTSTAALTDTGKSPSQGRTAVGIGPMTWAGGRFSAPVGNTTASVEFVPGEGWRTAGKWPAIIQRGTNVGVGDHVVFASSGPGDLDPAAEWADVGAVISHAP